MVMTAYMPRIVLAANLVNSSMQNRSNCFMSISPKTVQNSVCIASNKLSTRMWQISTVLPFNFSWSRAPDMQIFMAIKYHAHKLANPSKIIQSNLGKVTYTIKLLKEVMSPYIIRDIYYPNFHALLRYVIIFRDMANKSKNTFKLKKRVIIITWSVSKQLSCRQIFKEYNTLTVASLYIIEVVCYIIKYKNSQVQKVHIYNYHT